jgi:hypothetical protein
VPKENFIDTAQPNNNFFYETIGTVNERLTIEWGKLRCLYEE